LRRPGPVQGRNERSIAPLNAALVGAAHRPPPGSWLASRSFWTRGLP
jgi:hypothetical protein